MRARLAQPLQVVPPPRADAFFGREAELARLLALFEQRTPLVTLLATGGMGKTRLAKELLLRWSGRSRLVDLSGAHSPGECWELLRRGLGAESKRGASSEALALRAVTALGPVLLVLDNLEQLADAETAVARLMAAAPQALLLATSRVKLGLGAERVVELGPLETEGDSPARRLFLDRLDARLAAPTPDDALTRANVRTLVQALDGIPLALELAAYRAASVGVPAMAAWAGRALDLGDSGPAELPARHRTLRRTLEGSFAALDDTLRAALEAVSVFRDGFDAEDFAAVSGESGRALSLLEALRDRALLQHDGAGRFSMKGVIAEYAREACTPERWQALRTRHARHFAREVARRTQLPESFARWGQRNAENLEAARACLFEQRADPDCFALSCQLLCTLGELSVHAHGFADVIGQLDAALSQLESVQGPPALAFELWLLRARTEDARGRSQSAGEDAARAAQLAEQLEDRARKTQVMRFESLRLARAGSLDEACASFAAARKLHDAPLGGSHAAHDVIGLSSALRQSLRLDEARAVLEEYLRGAPRMEDRALATLELGMARMASREYDAAAGLFESVIPVFLELGWSAALARSRLVWGIAAHHLGQLDAAAEAFREVVAQGEALGLPRAEGYARGYLGVLAFDRGDLAEADALLQSANVPDDGHRLLFHAFRAAVLVTSGQREAAERHWAEAHRGEVPPSLAGSRALQRVHFHLADAATAAAARDERGWEEARQRARALCEQVPVDSGETEIARDVALRAIARQARRSPASEDVLWVEQSGAWFARGRGPQVDCRRHANVRRALVALARAQLERAGAPVEWSALVKELWPEGGLLESSAKNRLRVTIASLRKAGLEELLVTEPGGYRLKEQVEVRFASRPLTGPAG